MTHIFISYKHQDRNFALQVKQQMSDAGFEIWIDEHIRAGRKWRDEIDEKLRKAFALVLILTPDAVKSPYVNYEWIFALGAEVEVVPIYRKTIDKFPYRLEDIQYLDFRFEDDWHNLKLRLKEIEQEYRSKESIQRAKNLLTSPDEVKRKQGIDALVQLKAEGTLIEIMHGKSYPDVRVGAAMALGDFRNSEAIPVILEVLYSDSDQNLRLRAAKIFASLGKKVIPMLQKALKDGDDFLRSYAAITLGQAFMTDVTSVEHLIAALNDSSSDVRAAAIESLGSIGDPTAAPYLTKILLEDENIMLRQKAALALGQIGDENTIESLLNVLRNPTNPHMVQDAVIDALENIGGKAELHLIEGLSEEDKWIRTISAYLLGKLASIQAIPGLIYILEDNRALPHSPGWPGSNGKICDVAAKALESIGTPEALAAIEEWRQKQGQK